MGSIDIEKDYLLSRLQYYLNYELSTILLFWLSFYSSIFMFITVIAAIIFAPYMLYVLFTEKKNGWLITFIIMVIVPLILIILFNNFGGLGKFLFLLPLASFYFYCFLLRLTVNDWVAEIRAKRQYNAEKKIRDDEMEGFMSQFKD